MFENRKMAGIILASKLENINEDYLVMAIPRGGVIVGYEIAKKFHIPLELLFIKKIGYPFNPEVAIGAVSETGHYILDNYLDSIDQEWLKNEINNVKNICLENRKKYYDNKKAPILNNKKVILVDDGIATGLTMLLAIEEIRLSSPKEIIVAVPVIGIDVAAKIENVCDSLISSITVNNLESVSRYYYDFEQVRDVDIINLINKNTH